MTYRAEELRVPAVVRQRLNASQFRLGIIALTEGTMDDLIPGASVLVIDKQWRRVTGKPSKNDRKKCVEKPR